MAANGGTQGRGTVSVLVNGEWVPAAEEGRVPCVSLSWMAPPGLRWQSHRGFAQRVFDAAMGEQRRGLVMPLLLVAGRAGRPNRRPEPDAAVFRRATPEQFAEWWATGTADDDRTAGWVAQGAKRAICIGGVHPGLNLTGDAPMHWNAFVETGPWQTVTVFDPDPTADTYADIRAAVRQAAAVVFPGARFEDTRVEAGHGGPFCLWHCIQWASGNATTRTSDWMAGLDMGPEAAPALDEVCHVVRAGEQHNA